MKVRDYMNTEPVTLTPDTKLHKAVDVFLAHRISGASVVDIHGTLVGVLSESDCLRGILNGSYFDEAGGTVGSFMSEVVETIDADANILKAAEHFVQKNRRRLPVMERGRLVGQISRRDLLLALKSFNDQGKPKRG
ncbi:inosine-5'-monophosphate dehydrogenase [Pseudomonas saudimassiliensis]|uniref:Inosine-5'-monophosphate dehydrogenase n=2 Tax=Pseudomonas saudimassiliensis TaxID=1461581 RepID=A0A078MFM3_9PSED|nr:inosine-5'-monophosphate dehydrogenase [Pseudomonas saudimassiliensis]CEF27533.1 inosine-5'-monophosphate dehydrogenase [Pseudomonas saudimassiliensis]